MGDFLIWLSIFAGVDFLIFTFVEPPWALVLQILFATGAIIKFVKK